jgi:hypothetical protein
VTVILMGSPQSRQGASMDSCLSGKSQLTAGASSAQMAYHFCSPSTAMWVWVGMLENGESAAT